MSNRYEVTSPSSHEEFATSSMRSTAVTVIQRKCRCVTTSSSVTVGGGRADRDLGSPTFVLFFHHDSQLETRP